MNRVNERRLVPVGLERLLGMAAADAEFARALTERRGEAVAASGVVLTAAEEAMLAATGDAALGQLVAGVGRRLAGEDRRTFLGQAGAALLLLAGGGMAVGAGMAAGGCAERAEGSPREIERRLHPLGGGNVTGSRPGRKPSVRRPVRVRLGKGRVKGAMDREIVRRILKRHLRGIEYCYLSVAAGAGKKPKPGLLTVDFQITGVGRTRAVKVSKGGPGAKTARCVARRMRGVRFPKTRDGKPVEVRWIFHFK